MKKITAILGVALAAAFVTTVALAQHAAPDHTGHTATDPSGTESAVVHDGEHGHDPGAHDGAHAGAHHGPEPINWTDLSDKSRPAFIGLLVNFGILVALYYTLGKKPVTEGLKQRRINIGKDIDEARTMLEEAKERATKYQSDLKNVDADAATAKSTLISAGKGEVERMVSDATERADRMQRDAERLVEQEKKQLQRDLLLETIDKAVAEAQVILEKSATQEDHARLANELLAELARKPAAPRMAATRTTGGIS